MLIVGAKGFAKEVLDTFCKNGKAENLAFYDDINLNNDRFLFETFPILTNLEQAIMHFKQYGNEFTIGIGNPVLRYKMDVMFKKIGGLLTSSISPSAQIGNYDIVIGAGSNILNNAIISNSTRIGKGCIVYYNSIVTHDCIIGDFVEVSPGASILGRCQLGSFIQIGANATILPDITIGNNVIVAAGAVVTKNITENSMVAGVPALLKKKLDKLDIEFSNAQSNERKD